MNNMKKGYIRKIFRKYHEDIIAGFFLGVMIGIAIFR